MSYRGPNVKLRQLKTPCGMFKLVNCTCVLCKPIPMHYSARVTLAVPEISLTVLVLKPRLHERLLHFESLPRRTCIFCGAEGSDAHSVTDSWGPGHQVTSARNDVSSQKVNFSWLFSQSITPPRARVAICMNTAQGFLWQSWKLRVAYLKKKSISFLRFKSIDINSW